MLRQGWVIWMCLYACVVRVESLLCRSSFLRIKLEQRQSHAFSQSLTAEDPDSFDAFPELDTLLTKATMKISKVRDISNSTDRPSNNSTSIESGRNYTIEIESISSPGRASSDIAEFRRIESADASISSISESFKNMIHIVHGNTSRHRNVLQEIKETEQRVTYFDKTGKRHRIPISANPLWFAISVKGGKEKKVVEEFQNIIRDQSHPLNAFVVDTFVPFRPGVELDGKPFKFNELYDSRNNDPPSIFGAGKYGYAPRVSSQRLKIVTVPSIKGTVFIKASMNPVIHDAIVRDIPNIFRFITGEDNVVYPVGEKAISEFLHDRQSLFPDEQSLIKKLTVGTYVKLKSKQRKNELPNEGYGIVLGVENGLVKVSVKCEKQDLEGLYDIRDLGEIDTNLDEFREKDEHSRIKQMLERLMEEEPNSYILRGLKKKGILDDFLYPERRLIREKLVNEGRPVQPINEEIQISSSIPVKLSTAEANLAAVFGGIEAMQHSIRDLQQSNAEFERATRKSLTFEQEVGLRSSTASDDYSFLDDLFPPAIKKDSSSVQSLAKNSEPKKENSIVSIDEFINVESESEVSSFHSEKKRDAVEDELEALIQELQKKQK